MLPPRVSVPFPDLVRAVLPTMDPPKVSLVEAPMFSVIVLVVPEELVT